MGVGWRGRGARKLNRPIGLADRAAVDGAEARGSCSGLAALLTKLPLGSLGVAIRDLMDGH